MSAAVGWFGDTLLTNGAIYPQHAAPKGWLRLRLLNGCNARSLNFATSDKRPLWRSGKRRRPAAGAGEGERAADADGRALRGVGGYQRWQSV